MSFGNDVKMNCFILLGHLPGTHISYIQHPFLSLSLFLSQLFSFPRFLGEKIEVSHVSALRETSMYWDWMMVPIHNLSVLTFQGQGQSGPAPSDLISCPSTLACCAPATLAFKHAKDVLPQGLCTGSGYSLCTNDLPQIFAYFTPQLWPLHFIPLSSITQFYFSP